MYLYCCLEFIKCSHLILFIFLLYLDAYHTFPHSLTHWLTNVSLRMPRIRESIGPQSTCLWYDSIFDYHSLSIYLFIYLSIYLPFPLFFSPSLSLSFVIYLYLSIYLSFSPSFSLFPLFLKWERHEWKQSFIYWKMQKEIEIVRPVYQTMRVDPPSSRVWPARAGPAPTRQFPSFSASPVYLDNREERATQTPQKIHIHTHAHEHIREYKHTHLSVKCACKCVSSCACSELWWRRRRGGALIGWWWPGLGGPTATSS